MVTDGCLKDKMSSSEHENDGVIQPAQESDNGVPGRIILRERAELIPKLPDLPTIEGHQESVRQVQQQTVQDTGKDSSTVHFGSCRISKLPENNELLKFEFSISKDIFWHYISEQLVENVDYEDSDQFWINGVMNQETGKILSIVIGRSGMSQT